MWRNKSSAKRLPTCWRSADDKQIDNSSRDRGLGQGSRTHTSTKIQIQIRMQIEIQMKMQVTYSSTYITSLIIRTKMIIFNKCLRHLINVWSSVKSDIGSAVGLNAVNIEVVLRWFLAVFRYCWDGFEIVLGWYWNNIGRHLVEDPLTNTRGPFEHTVLTISYPSITLYCLKSMSVWKFHDMNQQILQ